MTGAILGKSWWAKIKDRIRSFATNYCRGLNLDRVVVLRALEAKIDRAIKTGDSVETDIVKAELAFSHHKKYQVLVVRAKLKRMSCEANNMAQILQAKELRHLTQLHIVGWAMEDYNRRHL